MTCANLTRNPVTALFAERLNLWDRIDRLRGEGEHARANSLEDYLAHYLEPKIRKVSGL